MQSFLSDVIIKCYFHVNYGFKLSINSGHLLGPPSSLRTSIGGKLRDSMTFCKIILILQSVGLTVPATVSLPSINSPIYAFMTTNLRVLHLFSDAKDKHGL